METKKERAVIAFKHINREKRRRIVLVRLKDGNFQIQTHILDRDTLATVKLPFICMLESSLEAIASMYFGGFRKLKTVRFINLKSY